VARLFPDWGLAFQQPEKEEHEDTKRMKNGVCNGY